MSIVRVAAVAAVAFLSISGAELRIRATAEPPRRSLTPDRVHVARGSAAVSVPVTGEQEVAAISALSKISTAIQFQSQTGYFLVLFHDDIPRGDAEHILLAEGIIRLERPDLLPSQWLVEATDAQVHALADWDEVAYIFPASDALVNGEPLYGCIGPVIDTGPIAQYVANVGQGWDGAGRGAVTLTYSVQNTTRSVPADRVAALVEKAINEWSRHAAVRFEPGGSPSANRNVNVLFASGTHGDSYPFDGPRKVLAHTFYPAGVNPEPIAGDMHLDDDEPWTDGGGQPDLYAVVLHEIGHALGLGHSDRPSSVMYPYYRTFETLQQDDISAIQRLYALPAAGTPAGPTPATSGGQSPSTPANPPVPSTPATNPPANPPAPSGDKVPPSILVTSPAGGTYPTSAATLRVSGRATDNVAVEAVTWQRGSDSGAAEGTTIWSFQVPLLRGSNSIVIRARDAAGNTAWRSIYVTRK